MFHRLEDGALHVTAGAGEPVHRVSTNAIGFVSMLRRCERTGAVLLTGTRAGDPEPDVMRNERGKLRLFRWEPGAPEWDEVYRGYAHDPVCLADGSYAVHRGAGVTVVAADGRVLHETKVGRFGWGPPSLSVNPGGDRLAWIRWKGDDRKLTVQRPLDDKPRTFPQSCFGYAWLDDGTLVYYLGGFLRLLDVESGKTRAFAKDLSALAARSPEVAPELPRHLREPDHEERVTHVQVVGDALWFSVLTFSMRLRSFFSKRFSGLFRVGRDGRGLELVATLPDDRQLRAFHALPDGSVLIYAERYEKTTIVERPTHALGPLAPFLEQGWHPLLTSGEPEFGFHALPG